MEILIYIGSFASIIGLIGLGYCIWLAIDARRSGFDDTAMKTRLQKVAAINMGALGLSALGLMMIVMGILL